MSNNLYIRVFVKMKVAAIDCLHFTAVDALQRSCDFFYADIDIMIMIIHLRMLQCLCLCQARITVTLKKTLKI